MYFGNKWGSAKTPHGLRPTANYIAADGFYIRKSTGELVRIETEQI